jgi:hypothetical protein
MTSQKIAMTSQRHATLLETTNRRGGTTNPLLGTISQPPATRAAAISPRTGTTNQPLVIRQGTTSQRLAMTNRRPVKIDPVGRLHQVGRGATTNPRRPVLGTVRTALHPIDLTPGRIGMRTNQVPVAGQT